MRKHIMRSCSYVSKRKAILGKVFFPDFSDITKLPRWWVPCSVSVQPVSGSTISQMCWLPGLLILFRRPPAQMIPWLRKEGGEGRSSLSDGESSLGIYSL